jgi:hypothetical protein
MTPQELLNAAGIHLDDYGPGEHPLTCPQCSRQRQHRHQKFKCLSVKIDGRGACWHCNHCGWSGPEKENFAAIYHYPEFRKVRYPAGHIPPFHIQHRNGGWQPGAGGADTDTLYRYEEVQEAIALGHRIAIVEGEKDVNSLWAIGVCATCNTHGASKPGERPKWKKPHSDLLRGADIVVFNDNDPSGYAHAEEVCRLSVGVAARVCRLDLKLFWYDIPEGGDVSDFLAAGYTREQLDALIEHAPEYVAKQEAPPQQPEPWPLFDPWAEFIVPPFPIDILPPVASEFVATHSVLLGCDPSAMATAVLATFSGALSHQFALRMMRNGPWYENPRLWILHVGDPSKKKTPIFNTATRPITDQQNYLSQKYETELRDYEATKEKDKDSRVSEPKRPARLISTDITVEKLADILARSGDRGLLIKRDEIAGWVGAMERYSSQRGSAADRAVWLKAFDGGSYDVDRIKRGEIHVHNLSVSLLGGIQPARLAELHGLTSDGLLQRFLPVMMGPSQLARDEPGDNEDYATLVRKLILARPERLILNEAALEVMNDIRQNLHNLEAASGGLANGFQAFVGKLPGYAGRLALILHMAADPEYGQTCQINETIVENVRRLIFDFIIPHGHEFYRTAESTTDGDRLRKIASWILTSGKARIVTSDLTHNVRDLRGLTVIEINKRVSPLVAGGWLEPTEPGPACRAWTVNPAVGPFFEQRRQQENEGKQQLRQIMARDFAARREQKGAA